METGSEKRRRGRPKTVGLVVQRCKLDGDPFVDDVEVTTDRTRQNRVYHQIALVALGAGDDPRFDWLTGTAGDGYRGMQRTLLAELGRLRDDDRIREVALELCQHRPTRREAIAYIRRVRGVRKEPTGEALAHRLLRTINEFIADYPDTTWQYIQEQIELVDFVVKAKRNDSTRSNHCVPAESEGICRQQGPSMRLQGRSAGGAISDTPVDNSSKTWYSVPQTQEAKP